MLPPSEEESVGPPSLLRNGKPTLELPKEPDWVTPKQFADRANVHIITVRRYISNGSIETIPHPLIKGWRVIPIRILHRALMTKMGLHVPYKGREYPYQFYLYYCLASYGARRDLLTNDLDRYGLKTPRDRELKAMEEAIFTTASKEVKQRHGLGFRYNTLVEFEDWMESLGFAELYEDPIGFIPPAILNSTRGRFLMEIMASSGIKPQIISEKLFAITDMNIEARVIKNYLMMFFYIRTMEEDHWLEYLSDIRGVNPREAKIRSACCDSRVELYKYLGLTGDLDFRTEIEKCFWASTALYQKCATSDDVQLEAASGMHARVMQQHLNSMIKLKEVELDEATEAKKRRNVAATGGMNPVNIPEASDKDDDPVWEEMVERGEVESDDDGKSQSVSSA